VAGSAELSFAGADGRSEPEERRRRLEPLRTVDMRRRLELWQRSISQDQMFATVSRLLVNDAEIAPHLMEGVRVLSQSAKHDVLPRWFPVSPGEPALRPVCCSAAGAKND
jgi:hypothetical protein